MAQDAAFRPLAPGDADWVVLRHAELYHAAEAFDASFEALVARVVADLLATPAPAVERGWIAEGAHGARLGCIFCARLDAETAQLRLFLVEPAARGTGLGQRLLDALLAHARAHGFARVRLWTHESHRAACRLYARNGFTCVDSRPVRSFGRDLVTQTWEKPLGAP